MRRYVFPDGHAFECDHRVGVELIVEAPRIGDTIWSHGDNRESVMVVSPEMRKDWDRAGTPSVEVLSQWIERVHEYEALR